MRSIWAVVLAAGSGNRFGADKMTTDVRGRPLLFQSLERAAAARKAGLLAGVVAVVAGHETARIAKQGGALVVINPTPELGLASSLRLGVRRLDHPPVTPEAGAALVMLGDQPLVRQEVVAAVGHAWRKGARIVRPVYADEPGVPGHPVLLDRSAWLLLDDARGDRGLGPLLTSRADWVTTVPATGCNPDIDTPADVADLED